MCPPNEIPFLLGPLMTKTVPCGQYSSIKISDVAITMEYHTTEGKSNISNI
jgi:hypothetical protein